MRIYLSSVVFLLEVAGVAGMGPIAGVPASKGAVGPTMAVLGLP
jgi:hypothetical protein